MSNPPFFHVGILVPDMNEAIARFSEVLGIEFAEPSLSHVPEFDSGGKLEPVDVLCSYSRQGPPHIELVQAFGDGPYGAHNGYGLHHIGAWTENCATRMAEFAAKGIHTEAVYRDGDKNFGGYFDPAEFFNVRLEVSPLSIKPNWQAWVDGGPAFVGQ